MVSTATIRSLVPRGESLRLQGETLLVLIDTPTLRLTLTVHPDGSVQQTLQDVAHFQDGGSLPKREQLA